uniref:hypothetical protein n=2 Tax=Flavobacterium sp. TaxID=239 RepID=UPI00404A3BB5
MSEFDKVMSKRTDFELFDIINYKRNSYKSEALISAEKEFHGRNISSHQIAAFEKKIQKSIETKAEKENQKTELKRKAFDIGNLLLPTEKSTYSKSILSLSIFLTISYFFYLFRDFEIIKSFFSDLGDWDSGVFEFLFPFILFPIGIFGLWKNNNYGWYLIVGLLTYLSFSTIFSGMSAYKYSMENVYGIGEQLEALFPKPSIAAIIFRFVVLFGIVIFLNRSKTLEIFKVRKIYGLIFVALIVVITTIFWWRMI